MTLVELVAKLLVEGLVGGEAGDSEFDGFALALEIGVELRGEETRHGAAEAVAVDFDWEAGIEARGDANHFILQARVRLLSFVILDLASVEKAVEDAASAFARPVCHSTCG